MEVLHFDQERILKNQLRRISTLLERGQNELADRLCVSSEHLEDYFSSRKPIDLINFLDFSQGLNLSFDALFSGKVDWIAFEKTNKLGLSILPEKYQVSAFSRKRTTLHILMYLDRFYPDYIPVVMNRFQLSQKMFENPNDNINILLISEVTEFLKKIGISTSFSDIGKYSFYINKNLSELKQSTTTVPMELINEHTKQASKIYDQNFIYEFEIIHSHKGVLRCWENKDVLSGLRLKKLGNKLNCKIRTGMISVIPKFLGLSEASVVHDQCIHMGDACCSYIVTM